LSYISVVQSTKEYLLG